MAFHAIPESGPVAIAGQETSPLFEFFVPEETEETFVRVIALFRDNEPLGGEPPTFQIRAGGGIITSIGPDSPEMSIPGSAGSTAGSVRCQREPQDVFLLTISNLAENSGPWKMRIKNNDPEPLRFLGFSSHHEEKTLQPWISIGEDPARTLDVDSHPGTFLARRTVEIPIHNWGTAPLMITEVPGTPIGDSELHATVATFTPRIDPHHVGHLIIEFDQIPNVTRTISHIVRSNDKINPNTVFKVRSRHVSHSGGGPGHQPAGEFFCRAGCGCQEFSPPGQADDFCGNLSCGHHFSSHLPV